MKFQQAFWVVFFVLLAIALADFLDIQKGKDYFGPNLQGNIWLGTDNSNVYKITESQRYLGKIFSITDDFDTDTPILNVFLTNSKAPESGLRFENLKNQSLVIFQTKKNNEIIDSQMLRIDELKLKLGQYEIFFEIISEKELGGEKENFVYFNAFVNE